MTSTSTSSTSPPASTGIGVGRSGGLDPSLILERPDRWADFFRMLDGIPDPEKDYVEYLWWKSETGRTDPWSTH